MKWIKLCRGQMRMRGEPLLRCSLIQPARGWEWCPTPLTCYVVSGTFVFFRISYLYNFCYKRESDEVVINEKALFHTTLSLSYTGNHTQDLNMVSKSCTKSYMGSFLTFLSLIMSWFRGILCCHPQTVHTMLMSNFWHSCLLYYPDFTTLSALHPSTVHTMLTSNCKVSSLSYLGGDMI